MGLDITSYSRLKAVGQHTDAWCEDEQHITAYAYLPFPDSFRDIKVVDTDETFMWGGCYEITPETETHQFRAGSYGGYNLWRADLQDQFNPYRDPEKPFFELIWFADNEGVIGPEAAKDLLADFRQHADHYQPGSPVSYYARESYADWTRAFELAADGGLVDFH